MSRGGYTSAIDMWSLGCIFGELLQRATRVGSANTPHLQVAGTTPTPACLECIAPPPPRLGRFLAAGEQPVSFCAQGEPGLQVAPLFAIHGLPKTPNTGYAPHAEAPFSLLRACLLATGSSCRAAAAQLHHSRGWPDLRC